MSHARRVWTEAEFMALPESMDRIELIDGEVYSSPTPTVRHQRIVQRLMRALFDWVDAHPPAEIGQAPLDVRIAEGRVLQPDVFVCLRGLPDVGLVTGPPDLVVEVLSSKPSHDRVRKRAVYEAAGVPEYWMVDPDARAIEVVTAGMFTVHHGTVRSVALPGFAVDVDALMG